MLSPLSVAVISAPAGLRMMTPSRMKDVAIPCGTVTDAGTLTLPASEDVSVTVVSWLGGPLRVTVTL